MLWLFTSLLCVSYFFFFNDTATTEIYTLSLHDALPILDNELAEQRVHLVAFQVVDARVQRGRDPVHDRNRRAQDRKSTRLNSSHTVISYAVFCLKKKKKKIDKENQYMKQTRHN